MVDKMLEAIADDLDDAIDADKKQEADAEKKIEQAEITLPVVPNPPLAAPPIDISEHIDAKLAAHAAETREMMQGYLDMAASRMQGLEQRLIEHEQRHETEQVPAVVEDITPLDAEAPKGETHDETEPERRKRAPSRPPARHRFGSRG